MVNNWLTIMGILTITGWWYTYSSENKVTVGYYSQKNGNIKFMFQTTKQTKVHCFYPN